MDGEEGELGHVLEKQKNDGGCVGLYRTILHQVRPWLLSCQSCVPMSVIKFRSSFQNLFYQEDVGSPDAGTDSHDWGRWNLVTYL
jgi:hypothetical protein